MANSAVASGCSASDTRNFFTMSASNSKSRLVCTVQVRSIMSRPSERARSVDVVGRMSTTRISSFARPSRTSREAHAATRPGGPHERGDPGRRHPTDGRPPSAPVRGHSLLHAAPGRSSIDPDDAGHGQPDTLDESVADTDEFGPVPGEPYFETNTIKLVDREEDVLVIRASAMKHAVHFRLRINYLLGGSPKTMVVDDKGEPFSITPLHCAQPGVASYQRGLRLRRDRIRSGLGVRSRRRSCHEPDIVKGLAGVDVPSRGHELSCLTR